MNNPKITIITVCYNAVNELEGTILSVINQTYKNIEYIVIDGGSKDGTIDIIKKYEDRIDLWISEPDNGIFDAMNKGIKFASGEWINMMNAGDYFYSDNAISDVMKQNIPDNVSFLYSDCQMRFSEKVKVIWQAEESEGNVFHQASIYKKGLHDIYGYYCVKKPIVMADALFFFMIPSSQYFHVSGIIASYDMDGISINNFNCRVQVTCLKYIFHKISLSQMFYRIIKLFILSKTPIRIISLYRRFFNM